MDVVDVLRAHGGVARWDQLRAHASRSALARSISAGAVVRPQRGTYALPDSDERLVLATRQRGVQSHTTAAQHWHLAVVRPEQEHVTVPWKARRSSVPPELRLHYRDLPKSDVRDGVTTPARTVLDCAADLPLREALAVGDSALRQRLTTRRELRAQAAAWRGPKAARVRRVVKQLDGRAANAFESAARAILLDGGIGGFQPQLVILHNGVQLGRVDLGDPKRRVIVECESFEWHGNRGAFARDCRRYCVFVAHGWRVLRITWEQVMFEPQWVLDVVSATVDGGRGTRSTADQLFDPEPWLLDA